MKFVESSELYPLKFVPIYQRRIWGGTLMTDVLHRDVPAALAPVGESWEIVDREGEDSVIANGELAGAKLSEVVRHYGRQLLGARAANAARFPLLVKLIDAGERLSLQVHPDESVCAQLKNGAEPKTEMWYIVAAKDNAKILAGLHGRATKQQLKEKLNDPAVEDMLQVYPSAVGDAYFITSGTLHAIGGGNLILEIQQNSDTTYRVSDWGRVDDNGKPRELHVDLGLKSINFMNRTSPRIAGASDQAGHNRKFSVVNNCRFFSIDDLRLTGVWNDDTASSKSFHMISAINAPVKVGKPEHLVELGVGETALLPACLGAYIIEPMAKHCTVLKTTL